MFKYITMNFLIFFLMLISFSQIYAQGISGTYTIPGAEFATIKAAIDSLNLVGVGTGGATFNVTAAYTEPTTDALVLTATGTSGNQIVFQKTGVGADPLISRTDAGTLAPTKFGAQGDAVLIIQGSDYVTFDGIDVTSSLETIEYGYYLRKAGVTDGCKYVTIKNSVIDLTKGTSRFVVGIYSSNNDAATAVTDSIGITVTTTGGRNEYVTLTGNTVQDVFSGIYVKGFNHTVTPWDLQDFNFTIGTSGQGNTIRNYAGNVTPATVTAYGILLHNHTNPTVSYNTIDNANLGVNASSVIHGIYMWGTAATNLGGDVVMNNNNITINQGSLGAVNCLTIAQNSLSMTVNNNTFSIGSFTTTTGQSYLINITGTATTKTVNGNQNIGLISKTVTGGGLTCLASSGNTLTVGTETFTGNKFSGITLIGTTGFTGISVSSSGSPATCTRSFYNNKVSDVTMVSGAFTGMNCGSILTQEVYNDTVMNCSGTGSATGISTASSAAGLTETVRDNYVTGLNFAGGSGTFTGIGTGGPSGTSTRYLYNNTVTNCAGGTGFQSYGINGGNITNQEIYNNLVSGITVGGNLNGLTFASQGNGVSTVYNNTVYDLTVTDNRAAIGISNASAGTTYFYKNSVSKLRATNAGTTVTVRGIDVTIGYKNYIYNNLVSDLNATITTATGNVVMGINSTNSANTNSIYLYNNTVYVNSTGTTYKSYGIYSNSSHNTELRNNLVVNNSAGLAYAYARSSNALGTYSLLSDNNNFYSTYRTYTDGTNTDTTISQFKARFYPREQSSFAENSPFMEVATAPFNVHINTAIASQTESGGRPVATPIAITNDYDGDVRNATFPDVGADEFTGIASDLTGPAIVYTPLGYTGSLTDRTLIANISDPSGVSSTAILYWRKHSDTTWTADTVAAVAGNDYTFTFGGGAAPNDTVLYYIAAQDLATTPNVRIVPTPGSGGYTANPPAASTPPTNPDRYVISSVSLAGDYTVGVAEFNRITGLTITFERSGGKLIPMENGKPYTGDLYVKKAEHPEYNYPDNVQGIYTTLTSAVSDLNLRGVTAPVNFLLTDAVYDSTTAAFPLVIKVINENLPTAANQVTFKPNTGVTSIITHPLASNALFKILSKYINMDGSNSGGTDRSLTIENSSITSPRVIWYGSEGTNPISWCTVKNCKIIVPGAAADGAGVSIADVLPNTAGYSNNITVQNNYITGPYGVYVFGPVVNNLWAPGNGSGISIDGNTIDSSFNGGMYLNGLDGISVTNNTVSNVRGTTGGGGFFIYTSYVVNSSISNNIIGPNSWVGGTVTGIRVGSNFVTNSNLTINGNTISGLSQPSAGTVVGIFVEQQTGGVVISNNKISNLKQSNTTSRAAIGINIAAGIPNGGITVANNFIWDIASYGDVSLTSNNAYGIAFTGFTAGANGYKVYHNTVALTDSQTLATGNPACLMIGSSVNTPGALDIRDNIFANYMTNGANRFAVINQVTTNVNLGNINYNDYYTTGSNIGRQGSTNYADITAWRTATGQDVNSIQADPVIVSNADLHINPNYQVVDGKGTYLGLVPSDIDGDTRNNPPDIGADEYSYVLPVDPAAFAAAAFSSSQINLTWTKSVNLSDVIVAYNTTSNFGAPVNGSAYLTGDTLAGGGTIIYSGSLEGYNHTGLAGETTYYYKAWSTNGPNQYSSPGLTANATTALALPYFQDFNAALTLPSGWAGDFAVAANHGTSGSNGLTFNLYDTEPTAAARSPWVGAVQTNTALEFDYRIVNWSGYPGTATVLGDNTIQIQVSTDDVNYTTVYTIDSSNHVTSTSFTNRQVLLSAYDGSTIYVKFLGTWSSGDYYVDIDNFYIGNAHLLNPGSLTAAAISASQIDVAFTTNPGLSNVVIVWNTTGTFTDPAGTPPAVGDPFAGGTLLYNGIISPVNHTGLTASTLYYYKAFSYDAVSYSTGITASAATWCPSVTVPVTQSFDDVTFPPLCWTGINAGSGNNWVRATTNTYAGAGTMAYGYNSASAANAWMISQGLDLTAGTTYIVGFWQKVASATFPEKLKVTVGTLPTVAAQSTVIWDNAGGSDLTNTTYMYRTAFYTPSVTGTYYFAFNVYSDADMYNLYVDEISILAQPAIDLSFTSFYQDSGLPVPKNGNISDYSVTMSKDSREEGLAFVTTGTGVNSSDVNNSTLVQMDYQIQLADVTLKGIIENLGSNAAPYSLDYSVNGIPQTPYAGPSVNTGSTDTATIAYTPAEMGTFIVPGTITVTGDEVAANNNAQFRMRIYPDTYSRTIYDRGDNVVNSYIGYNDNTIRVKAGVRYTAGGQIKLAGVDFIGRTEAVASGEWEVQVRAAGTTTGAPGAVLYTKVYNTSDYFASAGAYFFFPFGNDAPVIASGSDYWITVKAPLGTLFPSAAHNSGITIGHSFIEDSPDTTAWYSLILSGTEYAWIMRAVHVDVAPTTFQLTVNVNDGWNMVSIPGLLPTNQNVTTWWPGKDPAAGVFKFVTGYQAVTDVVPGTGYWMKNMGAQTYNTGDEWPAGGISFVAHDPIPALSGWNMFAGYEQSVPTSGLTTTPSGLITGNVYKYGTGYTIATQLEPGYGYWVKLTGSGSINIPSAGPSGPSKIVNNVSTEGFGKITISDKTGRNYSLYAVQGEADLSHFDLPPYPPQGMFDVRYSSQRYAERLSSTPQAIELMGVQYPVKVKAEGIGIIVSDETGKEIARLKTGEEVSLNTAAQKLMVSENVIPAVYTLEQNYPNPFNPSTVIEFSLPDNAANVKLSIYNALGEKVTELVNTSLAAGKYTYQWNAGNFATGLYVYELRTDKFVSVKKMMLIK